MQYISPLNTVPTIFPKKIALMGSTGTIGSNALAVIRESRDFFQVIALAGGKNIKKLAEQANEFTPPYLALQFEQDIPKLKELLKPRYAPIVLHGKQGYSEISSLQETDIVLSAQVGAAGLAATVSAVSAGKHVALANKESLVLAGGYLRKLAYEKNANIIPVDSEHYALFQCLAPYFAQTDKVKSLILTASGGPFHGKSREFLEHVTVEDALKHPNWKMGAKITIDSASLMNKGLEVIEACHLYGVNLKQVEVVVHPQSIIHSLVSWQDGSITAQLATPDMKLPICAAFSYPDMLSQKNNSVASLDLTAQGLNFYKPNKELFPCLDLAYQAFVQELCIELNAANEIAVERFLRKDIQFLQIPQLIRDMLCYASKLPKISLLSHTIETALSSIEERDARIREQAKNWH